MKHAGLTCASFFALAGGGYMLNEVEAATKRIEVQGHRGARAKRPENTLPAFAYAIEIGADVLELDVNVTRDDRLVIAHDQTVNAELCLGPKGERLESSPPIRTLTLEEVRRFDCGSRPNPRFSNQVAVPKTPMPTLEELFDLVMHAGSANARTVKLNVEAKSVPGRPDLSPPPDRFAELLVGAFEKSGLRPRCILQSFDHRVLRAAKKLEPRLATSALVSDNFVDYVAVAKGAGASIVSPNQEWITKEAVAELHAAKIAVVPWTANTPEAWQRLADMHVDAIITDDPEALIRYLEARGLR